MTAPAHSPLEPGREFRLVIFGDGTVRTVPLHGLRWTLGRAPDTNIPLRDPTVSRKHLILERQGDAFRFRDLGGSNPLLLDGRVANEGTLEVGQTLQVGLTRLAIEPRRRRAVVVPPTDATIVLSREVIDDEAQASPTATTLAAIARRVLERLEWTFADLGELSDVAEPLLELGLNLTQRRRGVLGRLLPQGGFEMLASLDLQRLGGDVEIPETVLHEARRLNRPNLLTSREPGRVVERLVVPMGPGPDGILVFEDPQAETVGGQELLRLGRTLGIVAWHRLQEATERLRLREEVQRLRFHDTTAHQGLLASARLQPLRQRLRELAPGDQGLLLAGEPGTEQEELARYLHTAGSRSRRPFVAIDVASLPATRLPGELFGDGTRTAAALRARGGTLFVAGFDGLAPDLQLRLVQSIDQVPIDDFGFGPPRLVVGVTGNQAAAVLSLLPRGVAAYFQSAALDIPPLRSAPSDVLALAELHLSTMGSTPDGSPRLLGERVKRILAAHPWPGNTAELRAVLETASANAGNQPIAPRHLPDELAELVVPNAEAQPMPTLAEMEKRYIMEVLDRHGGNRARAAQVLGIASSTLYDKIRKFEQG
jgi:transcriptional regulator with AAA-type ATPase domain